MRDFIEGLINLSKTIVVGIVVVLSILLIMLGMITGLAIS